MHDLPLMGLQRVNGFYLCVPLCSGPVVATVWEGKGVVVTGRKLVGATNPLASGALPAPAPLS